ncbi:MAG: uncharacterized protein A8A55_2512 [Amphiamblys sp. WSBS2006]|nr:MAG: uncharacterized protein A8A55_2512 [Amphiamblys sp. WSBS2006]
MFNQNQQNTNKTPFSQFTAQQPAQQTPFSQFTAQQPTQQGIQSSQFTAQQTPFSQFTAQQPTQQGIQSSQFTTQQPAQQTPFSQFTAQQPAQQGIQSSPFAYNGTPQTMFQEKETVYPPNTLFTALPHTEQMKYENKAKHIEKNKEKANKIQSRSMAMFSDIDRRLSRARKKYDGFQLNRKIHAEKYSELRRDDSLCWDTVEEGFRFVEQLKRSEQPPAESTTRYLDEMVSKAEALSGEIEAKLEHTRNTLDEISRQQLTQKTLTNILSAQQETYSAVVQRYFELHGETSEQKEKYAERRREFYSDYTDPFLS